MQIGMRQVSAETVEWFGTACRGGELTRTALARGLCEREGWRCCPELTAGRRSGVPRAQRGGGKGSAGILAHFGVAVNGAGRPLGAFLANADFRQDPERDSVRWTDGLDRAQGLAAACPDTRVVTVCDREGDSWELLTRARETGAALLVRASRGAKRRVAMDGGAGRTTETDGGPLHWMLLTTEGRAGVETARTALLWYELRWRIERFFHALKQGTRIEDRRLDHADDLRTCLAFDAITAFRVWDLTHLARERPDDPATWHVTQEDVTALRARATHHGFSAARGPPNMTVARFVTLTGGLAGFHPAKRQPLPGTQKLWEGVRVLSSAVIAIQAMQDWERNKTEKENTESSVID